MALFPSRKPAATPEPPAATPSPGGKKQTATPTRRQAEAARRERISPSLTPKEARKKSRAATVDERMKAMERAEATPGKLLMRDHVDARWSPSEWVMPSMMVLLALSLVVSPAVPSLVQPTLYATWAFFALVGIDIYLMWRQFKALAAQRIPNEPLKGLLNYGLNRSITLRRLRRPLPRVKRGDTL